MKVPQPPTRVEPQSRSKKSARSDNGAGSTGGSGKFAPRGVPMPQKATRSNMRGSYVSRDVTSPTRDVTPAARTTRTRAPQPRQQSAARAAEPSSTTRASHRSRRAPLATTRSQTTPAPKKDAKTRLSTPAGEVRNADSSRISTTGKAVEHAPAKKTPTPQAKATTGPSKPSPDKTPRKPQTSAAEPRKSDTPDKGKDGDTSSQVKSVGGRHRKPAAPAATPAAAPAVTPEVTPVRDVERKASDPTPVSPPIPPVPLAEQPATPTSHDEDVRTDAQPPVEKTREEKQSALPTLTPKTKTETAKKKISVFRAVVSLWSMLIVIAAAGVTVWGAFVWEDNAREKVRSEGYSRGMADAAAPASFDSVIKVGLDPLVPQITSAPGAQFPSSVVLTDPVITGWTHPGGTHTTGEAEFSVCYTGDGVSNKLRASVYVVSPDVTVPAPVWNVDSVTVTSRPCDLR